MNTDTGEKMKKIRLARGLLQSDISNAMGVSRQLVSRWESGERNINADQLIEYSKVVGVTLDYFSDNIPQRSLFQLMAQLQLFFSDPDITDDEKEKAYQQVMKMYLKYKESAENRQRGISLVKNDPNMPVAAHNDKKIDDDELALMRQDVDEL